MRIKASLWNSIFTTFAVLVSVFLMMPETATAQRTAKYGADFLAGGVGARALGMGGAYVALAGDVTSGYWNPAGLGRMYYPEVAYMHAERFAGVVSYDYGSAAFPINARSTVGLSLIRLGVDDIPNTLNAWDRERNQPLPNVGDHITRFSYAHYAIFVSYARNLADNLSIGVSGKVIRGAIGDFASSWGYSFDAGVQYRTGRFLLGLNVQDVTRMLQTWSINSDAFQGAELNYADFRLPEGGAEYVLPVARFGSGVTFPIGESSELVFGADVDFAFDGQRAYTFNLGDVSFHPRLGTEFRFKDVVALRAGMSQIGRSDAYGFEYTPTVGAGLHINHVSVDYGFGDFAGFASDLGYSHRVSLQVSLESEALRRTEE